MRNQTIALILLPTLTLAACGDDTTIISTFSYTNVSASNVTAIESAGDGDGGGDDDTATESGTSGSTGEDTPTTATEAAEETFGASETGVVSTTSEGGTSTGFATTEETPPTSTTEDTAETSTNSETADDGDTTMGDPFACVAPAPRCPHTGEWCTDVVTFCHHVALSEVSESFCQVIGEMCLGENFTPCDFCSGVGEQCRLEGRPESECAELEATCSCIAQADGAL